MGCQTAIAATILARGGRRDDDGYQITPKTQHQALAAKVKEAARKGATSERGTEPMLNCLSFPGYDPEFAGRVFE